MIIELEGLNVIQKRINSLIQQIQPGSQDNIAALNRIGSFLVAQTKMNIRKQKLIDLGALINSIQYKITNNTDLEAGSFGVPYAAIHEFGSGGLPGGVITPKKAKWLTIPTKQYKNKSPRQIKNLVFIQRLKDARTKAFLIDKKNNKLAYILVKRVKIKPRPYLQPALESSKPRIVAIIREMVQNILSSNP